MLRQSFNLINVLNTLPVTPAQPIAGPWGRGALGPPGKHLRQRGSSDSASARFGVPPLSRWLSVRISYWQEGVRSKQRRPTGEECVRERRRSECVTVGTEWETPAEGARGNFTGVYHCALSRRRDRFRAQHAEAGWKVDCGRTYWLKRPIH